jgi:hypothetical protein
MAVAYANPIPAPEFMEPDGRYDHAGYEARCKAYEAETEKYIRSELRGKHKHTGKIIRFPVADGYAQYMIWTPTKWIHLDEVDGYQADAATVRGTRAVDVDAMLDRERRMAELFGRSSRV